MALVLAALILSSAPSATPTDVGFRGPLEIPGAIVKRRAAMLTPRWGHTATLLPSGQVLVTGGVSDLSGSRLATAELYDPARDRWSVTAPMSLPREHHTATPLSNGTVLVVGGNDDRRAEIFDGVKGSWRFTKPGLEARYEHTATPLADGTVLVVGGSRPLDGAGKSVFQPASTSLATAELYDVVGGEWRRTGALHDASESHTATLLHDGRVLVTGGHDPLCDSIDFYCALPRTELYDPIGHRWDLGPPLPVPRAGHTATLMRDGRVLVAGGMADGSTIHKDAHVLDPARQQWTEIAGLVPTGRAESIDLRKRYSFGGRWKHTAVASPDGRVFVFGGVTDVKWGGRHGSLWTRVIQYDPATKIWTSAGDLGSPRIGHSTTSLSDGTILIIGGFNNMDAQETDRPSAVDGAVFRYSPAPRQHATPSPPAAHRAR